MQNTSIEWTEATWNPIRGCSRVSEGCRNCYAERVAARFSGEGQPYEGLAVMKDNGPHWTGKVELVEKHLTDPLRWKRPRRVFVNSMSDLFHESLDDFSIQRVFDVMYNAPRHTFQILTKRAQRMHDYLNSHRGWWGDYPQWKHVWLGVSVEDQKTADERIPLLLQTPAAVRFISAEPLLGPINLHRIKDPCPPDYNLELTFDSLSRKGGIAFKSEVGLDWVIVGGESGPKARPIHPQWARDLRDQCVAAGVPYFFKQWGGWEGADCGDPREGWQTIGISGRLLPLMPGAESVNEEPRAVVRRVGKKEAGRLLDGRLWSEFPR